MSLQDVSSRYLAQVEAELQEVVRAREKTLDGYYGMMRYHLGWADERLEPAVAYAGKRLRPLFCLLCCDAAGGDPWQAIPAACALELVHSFSLVHDDIQDESVIRRGRPAVWSLWGAAHGINVGDGLSVLARLALVRLKERGVPLGRCYAAIEALEQACLSLCEGQYLDMVFQQQGNVDLERYLAMIRGKTAALLAASSALGAIVSTDDVKEIELYRRLGENLGLAFQIQDDVLGIWGDEAMTGKSASMDLRTKKKTFPIVFALSQEPPCEASRQLALLFTQTGPLDEPAVETALAALESLDARAFAEASAEAYFEQALNGVDQVHCKAEAKAALLELVTTLRHRRA